MSVLGAGRVGQSCVEGIVFGLRERSIFSLLLAVGLPGERHWLFYWHRLLPIRKFCANGAGEALTEFQ